MFGYVIQCALGAGPDTSPHQSTHNCDWLCPQKHEAITFSHNHFQAALALISITMLPLEDLQCACN